MTGNKILLSASHNPASLASRISSDPELRYRIALAIRQKHVEETLRRRKQEFQSLVENSPDPISRLDLEGRYLYVNPAQAQLFGLSPQDIIGMNCMDFFAPDMDEEEKNKWQQPTHIFSDQNEHILEYRFSTSRGLRWLQRRELPLVCCWGQLAETFRPGT